MDITAMRDRFAPAAGPLPTPCQLWQGARNNDGYGVLKLDGRLCLVHRVVYALAKGELLRGQVVMHLCDMRACANPDHLMSGTQQDNMRDMHRKGRHKWSLGRQAQPIRTGLRRGQQVIHPDV